LVPGLGYLLGGSIFPQSHDAMPLAAGEERDRIDPSPVRRSELP
jgi:hypothetical protein